MTQRIEFLDGLKGLAALVVVFHHYSLAFFPETYTDTTNLFFRTPLNLIINGNFALVIFLILSGFSLSYKYFLTHDNQVLKRLALKRYFRLLPVILSINILAYFLVPLFSKTVAEVAKITGSWWWLGKTWQFQPNIWVMLKQSLVDVFFINQPMDVVYNTSLWIIPIFFLGTYLVVTVLWLFGGSRLRFAVYGLLLAALYSSYYLPLVLGMIIADGWVNFRSKNNVQWGGRAMFFGGLLIGSFPTNYTGGKLSQTIYQSWPLFNITDSAMIYHIIGGTGLILGLFLVPEVQKMLCGKVMLYLGKISYSLFVVHAIILASLGCWLFKIALPIAHSHLLVFGLMFWVALPVSLTVALALNRYIERSYN